MFRDEDLGVAAVHIVDSKFVIHSQLFGEVNRRKLERAVEASQMIDEGFRSRGVDRIYTWAETDEQYRYNLFMGYKPTGEEVVFDYDYPNTVYEFVKEL